MHRFQELYATEILPKFPKQKLKEATKKFNPRDFKVVKNEEEMKQEEEKRKESRLASKEEIEEEMKISLADRVTPYHNLTYEDQIQKKKE